MKSLNHNDIEFPSYSNDFNLLQKKKLQYFDENPHGLLNKGKIHNKSKSKKSDISVKKKQSSINQSHNTNNQNDNNKDSKDNPLDEDNDINNSTESKKVKKKVIILSDSMLKYNNGFGISGNIKQCNVSSKAISCAKISSMQNNAKPSLEEEPDHFVLHVGTNDHSSKDTSEITASKIISIAKTIKNDKHDITV